MQMNIVIFDVAGRDVRLLYFGTDPVVREVVGTRGCAVVGGTTTEAG